MAVAFRYVHQAELSLGASNATHNMAPRGHDGAANTTEANAQSLIRQSYTAKNLYCYVTTYTGTISTVLTGRDSGANGALTLTPTFVGVWEDTTNTMTLATGDLFNTQMVATGIGHGEAFAMSTVALTLEHVSDNIGILLASRESLGTYNSTVSYSPSAGSLTITTTEARVQRTVETAATLAKLFGYCGGGVSPVGPVFSTRVNAVNGAQSIAPSAVGSYEDTSNTDTIAVGDEIDYSGVTTSGSFYMLLGQVQSSSSALQHVFIATTSVAAGNDIFIPLEGGAASSTEDHIYVTMRTTNVLKNAFAYVSDYSLNATPTLRLRVNSTDNALGVSPTTTGVWEDTSNTYTLVATDEANGNIDCSAASSGSITTRLFSVEETQPPPAASFGIPFVMQSPSAVHMLVR